LAPSRRTEAERSFNLHLWHKAVTAPQSEDTAVRLADGFESAYLCARGWIQNLE